MADEGTPAPDDAPGDGSGGGAAPGGTVTPEAMAAVLEALAGLTELVTTSASEKAFPPKKPKDGEGDDDEEEDDDSEEDDELRRKAAESINTLLAQVKAALGRLQAAVTTPAQKRASNDPVLAKLGEVAASITKLETQLKEHGERIGKVEKNVGLPASRPPEGGGRGGGGDDDDSVSWPMDLNMPVDRSSVDKSLSFHDAGDK